MNSKKVPIDTPEELASYTSGKKTILGGIRKVFGGVGGKALATAGVMMAADKIFAEGTPGVHASVESKDDLASKYENGKQSEKQIESETTVNGKKSKVTLYVFEGNENGVGAKSIKLSVEEGSGDTFLILDSGEKVIVHVKNGHDPRINSGEIIVVGENEQGEKDQYASLNVDKNTYVYRPGETGK